MSIKLPIICSKHKINIVYKNYISLVLLGENNFVFTSRILYRKESILWTVKMYTYCACFETLCQGVEHRKQSIRTMNFHCCTQAILNIE